MKRRQFIQTTGILTTGVILNQCMNASANELAIVRIPESKRNFTSKAIEEAIKEFKSGVKDKELGWLFENCFPNTLDTTVFHTIDAGKPDTYVITGDIDAMWLRDSSAQVWPYLQFIGEDKPLQDLIKGVIYRQISCVNKDPYANAFYGDPDRVGEWASDLTDMQPGVHERKWEIDSLCYPIRLSYGYWKESGDVEPFDAAWVESIKLTLKTFKEQQRKDNLGPYKFQRTTAVATDTQPMGGYGYPVKPVGLICSAFRPSDDATLYSFLIPSNFFAVVSLREAAEMIEALANKEQKLKEELLALADEVAEALKKYAVIKHDEFGDIFAYEINGFGSFNLMDDANIPSLLSLPYLNAIDNADTIYQNTRKFVLSGHNPFFFKGTAAEGIGGPHIGQDMIWPMAITMRGLTSTSESEIKECVKMLKATHGETGFMHETFHKDDPKNFTRSWFAWANTLFGEFLWKTYKQNPSLLA